MKFLKVIENSKTFLITINENLYFLKSKLDLATEWSVP